MTSMALLSSLALSLQANNEGDGTLNLGTLT